MTPHTHPGSGRSADWAARRRGASGAHTTCPLLRRTRSLAALGALALSLVACDRVDQLLSIETPSRLPENTLLVPQNAQLLVNSALGDFQCAYGAYAVASGLAAGELIESTSTSSRWAYDRRVVSSSDAHYSTFGCEAIGVYTPLNTARYTNDQILGKLEEWTDADVPNRSRLIAMSANFAGYSLLLIGEGFCSAAIGGGAELQSASLFAEAEERFTRAMEVAEAAGEAQLLNLARVGRARARLNQGDGAGAAADAALAPATFVYNLNSTEVSGRYTNRVAAQNATGTSVSVGATYRNLNDPRVVAVDAGTNGADGTTRLWRQGKFTALTTPMPLATGVEAQLILAEARGGAQGVTILNALRARAGVGLPGLSAAEQANFTATLFEERRRELFLQGTRWFDMRRGTLTQVPAAGTPYAKGGSYGDQRCWPLPDVERFANPNIPDTPGA